jgi:acetylornithine deacetylase/succinyl-diaminopimelate desuccinylase-like protein
MALSAAADRVLGLISEDDVAELALALGRIDSPAGFEGAAGQFVHDWLAERSFRPRKVGMVEDRFNVVARMGRGDGPVLAFNSHLDTAVRSDEWLCSTRAADPVYHSAWREGDDIVGYGVSNDKGGMAAWLVACDAIRRAGVEPAGEVVLTAVCGEISQEPVDEFTSTQYLAKELGCRYAIARGAVADAALVAEGTSFTVGWVEAGKAFFKLAVYGDDRLIYTPYVQWPEREADNANAIVRAVPVIRAIQRWAPRYAEAHTYRCPGGTVEPHVNIGAVRGGVPYKIAKTNQVCYLYVDVRITPEQRPLDVKRELAAVIAETGVPFDLELFTYRRGFEAKGVEPVLASLGRAHEAVFGRSVEVCPDRGHSSMWRDINPYVEAGIPAVHYGPGFSAGPGGRPLTRLADLVDAARVYALVALDFCGCA